MPLYVWVHGHPLDHVQVAMDHMLKGNFSLSSSTSSARLGTQGPLPALC